MSTENIGAQAFYPAAGHRGGPLQRSGSLVGSQVEARGRNSPSAPLAAAVVAGVAVAAAGVVGAARR